MISDTSNSFSVTDNFREKLLLADTDCIPEIIQDLGFQGEEDIDSVVSEAVSYYKRTPRCLSRYSILF